MSRVVLEHSGVVEEHLARGRVRASVIDSTALSAVIVAFAFECHVIPECSISNQCLPDVLRVNRPTYLTATVLEHTLVDCVCALLDVSACSIRVSAEYSST